MTRTPAERAHRTAIIDQVGFTAKEWSRVPTHQLEICVNNCQNLPVGIGRVAAAFEIPVIASSLENNISGEIALSEDSPSGFQIKVNRHENRKRQRFTVAHEIGHFLLHAEQVLEHNGIVDNILYRSRLSNALEAQANRIAADLLMPMAILQTLSLDTFGTEPTEQMVPYLATQIQVSEIALKIRLGLTE